MDANTIKLKILEESGWTLTVLNDAIKGLIDIDMMYMNDELAYRTIARELGISVEEEREYRGSGEPKEHVPTALVKLEEAKNDLDDGEYFSTYFAVLAPFRAPKDTVGFLPIADETMQIDLKFWSDQFDEGKKFKAGKSYKVDGIQGSYSDQYGWGISFGKYTKVEEVDEKINVPITKIAILQDGWKTFVIKGAVDEVKPIGVDLCFCKECDKYAGTARQLAEAESDFFCEKCQEVTNLYEATPISGRIMDDSGSIDFGLPIDVRQTPFDDGDVVTISGGYGSVKNKFYVKGILSYYKKHNVTSVLDSFLKKKKKKSKPSKKATKKPMIDKAVDHYKHNKDQGEDGWCATLAVPDEVIKQFRIFDITTVEHVTEFVSALLVKGYAFMPEAGVLKAVY